MKISIVYISNGKRPKFLHPCLQSAKIFDEIIVVGNISEIVDDTVIKINAAVESDSGKVSVMRNLGADAATGDIIINADDDMFFPDKFRKKLVKFIEDNPNLDVFNTKIIGINGSRYWDRAIHTDAGESLMIDYDKSHSDLYYNGSLLIRKNQFAKKYKFDTSLGYYQKEDVEYSNRIKQAGYPVTIDPNNYAIHLDPGYTSIRNGENILVCERINVLDPDYVSNRNNDNVPVNRKVDVTVDDLQEKEFREITAYAKKFHW
jgi:hypothetical protein